MSRATLKSLKIKKTQQKPTKAKKTQLSKTWMKLTKLRMIPSAKRLQKELFEINFNPSPYFKVATKGTYSLLK